MRKKLDIIIKLIITVAVITAIIVMILPVLQKQGILTGTSGGNAAISQRPGASTGGGRTAAGAPAAAGQAVKAYAASTGTVSNYIKVNGDVITDVKIDIYPDVSGKIIQLNSSVGDYVRKDQIIAKVDPSLPGQNFAVSTVSAAISGTVLNVNVRPGDKVSPNTSILTIGDLTNLKLVTYIPEKFSGNLRKGLPAVVNFVSFPDELFFAKISEISPVIDPASRTIEIILNFDNRQSKIKTGMFASLKLVTEQVEGVLSIPAPAVFTYYGKDTVFVVKKDNTVERRTVEIGLSSVDMVEVKNGLEPGEIVVTEGQSLLSEGTAVKIIRQEL